MTPKEMREGDVLVSEDNYYVLVCKDKDGNLYGSLLCSIEHSCRNIPYSLGGKHERIFNIHDALLPRKQDKEIARLREVLNKIRELEVDQDDVHRMKYIAQQALSPERKA